LTPDYVLNEMSYVNMIMYNAVIPSYNSDTDGKTIGKDDEKINADDPKNRDKVKNILYGN